MRKFPKDMVEFMKHQQFFYMLTKEGEVQRIQTMDQFEEYLLECKKQIKYSSVMKRGESIDISTAFLGIQLSIHGKPKYFETMVFGGKFDEETWLSGTQEEAIATHDLIVKKVQQDG